MQEVQVETQAVEAEQEEVAQEQQTNQQFYIILLFFCTFRYFSHIYLLRFMCYAIP